MFLPNQAIDNHAHNNSGYTIEVDYNGRTGYITSGDLSIIPLDNGTYYTQLSGKIYTIAFDTPDGGITTQQLTPDLFTPNPAHTVPTQQLRDNGIHQIYQPIEQQILQEQQQAQAEIISENENLKTENLSETEQTVSPSASDSEIGAIPNEELGSIATEGRSLSRSDGGVNTQSTEPTPLSTEQTQLQTEQPENSTQQPSEPTPVTPIDLNTLSDDDFDTHIDTLNPTEAIEAISQRRGVEDADQYAHWRKAVLNKQRDAAQRKLNAKHKPFDPSRYNSYPEMKRAEALYNQQISQQQDEARATIDALDKQIADINQYQNRRNAEIAAEREAENPLRNGIAQAVEKLPINTLPQYIARLIATGTKLRSSDQFSNGLAAELGITPGSQEHRELLSILSNNEGMTPEQLAHYISENIEPEYRHLIAGSDHQDIRNTIIDTIQSGVTSRRKAYDFIANATNQLQVDEQRYYEQQELQAEIDADTEQAIREYEELLLSSITPDDLAIIDAMNGEYYDELLAIQQYEQEAYSSLISPSAELREDRGSGVAEGVNSNSQNIQPYDTTATSTTPRNTQQEATQPTIQPSSQPSDTTPIPQHSQDTATIRPTTTTPTDTGSTRSDVVDNQGNPIDANGNLIIEPVASIDEITDQDQHIDSDQAKLAHIASWQQAINAPIVVLSNIHEVNNPQARAAIASATLSAQRFPGWFSDGTIYLYLPHCTDTTDIDRTILHECIAHYGVRKLFPSPHSLNRFYDQVWNMMQHNDRQRFLQYPGISNLTGNNARRAAADEYIAHLAEQLHTQGTTITPEQTSIWQRIVSFLRNALRQAGINLRLSDTDLNNLLISSYNNLRNKTSHPSPSTSHTTTMTHPLPSERRVEGYSPSMNNPQQATGEVGGNTTLNQQPSEKTGNTTNTTPTQPLSSSTSDTELDIFLRENRAANDRHREQWKSIPRPRDLEKAYNAGDTQAIEQWKAGWEAFLQQLIPMDLPVIDGTITTASRNKAVKMVQNPHGYKVDKESSAYKAFDYIEKSLKKRKKQLERNLTEEERRTIDIVKRGLRGELNNTRLRAVSETFDSQLQQQIDGTLPAGHIYNLGMPSPILRSAGLPNLPIELAASRLTDKSMQENHPFDIAEVRGLVDAIQDPLAIFRSATHIGSFVVLTEIQHGGRNFVVAIEANRRQGRIEVNSIRSIHYRNSNTHIANWIEDGLLEYAHKERMSEWFSKQRYNSADVRKLFRHTAKIVQNFENPKLPDTRFRVANQNQAIFVSNARQAVENIRQDRATPEQWLAMLQNSGGIKAGEDRWLGLSDWLKNYSPSVSRSDIGGVAESRGGSNTITRQQILDFIDSNAIRIEEVHYSQFGEALIDQATRTLESELRQIGWDAMQEKYPGIEELFEYDGRELLWSENLASIGQYEDFILDNNITGANPNHNAINETREQYTTPHLTDNHEIALTIPGIEPYNRHDDVHFGDAGGGRAIAWIRFGDTTDSNGNPVLVIDEIQSKRHQDGREKGYRNETEYRNAVQLRDQRDPVIRRRLSEISDRLSEISDLIPSDIKGLMNRIKYRESMPEYAEWKQLKEEQSALQAELQQIERTVLDMSHKLVPDAPFDKNWHELAFKRMLRYAAENGYDHLAWTTGVQQAERYNIGNTISDIYRSYSNIIVGTQAGDIYIYFDSEGRITTGQFSGNTLDEVFGKGTADKILNMTPGQTLSGDNLHIGGEGMKAFYDRMIPSFVSKYVKKWGSKVQDITLPEIGDNGLTMHSVEITPDMRESVLQGQTMFRSVDTYTVTEDIKRIVGISSQVRHSHYASGTTDNGETWQIRISDHPAAFINIEDHLQEDEQMPDYFTSIVITDNPDTITRRKETLEQQRRQFNNSPDFENIELDQLIIDTRTLDSDNYQDFLDEFQEHFDLFRHTGRSYFNDDYGTRFRSISENENDRKTENENLKSEEEVFTSPISPFTSHTTTMTHPLPSERRVEGYSPSMNNPQQATGEVGGNTTLNQQPSEKTGNTTNTTPTQPLSPFTSQSLYDYAEQIILRTANYNNKLPGSHLRFRMTHRTEATVSGWINQRTDLNPTQRQAIIRYIDTLDSTAMQLATARWFTLGTIRIPDDITRVRQAMQVAHKAKVDPLTYDYPMAILNQFPNLNPSTKPINPDDLPTLNNKQSLPHGITIYNVDDTPQAQQHIRDIIDTHLGTRTNPWCITSAINGRLTDEARNFWKAYNAHPKRVAFRDGRIIAFFAADIPIPIWWDTQDRPHTAIPIAPLTEYNEQNNTIDTYNPDGTILNSTPAEQNENENPKTPNAPSSTNNVGTVANKREQSELVQSLPSESNLGDSHIAPLVRDTASQEASDSHIAPPVRDTATQENTHTIADATIAHIEQIGNDYTRYIDNIAEQVEQALTPQPTDDARTLAQKAILRFRFTDDTTTSPLAGRDAPPVREEISMGSVSPEEQDIIDQARANGTYLLAPNGRPTNLTPRQWVQVRTQAFKQWFGDWLKAARINKLRTSKDAVITGEEISASKDLKEYKKNALEYGKSLRGQYVNADTGQTISMGKSGIKEVLNHDYKNVEQLQSIAAIPQIIENAIYIDSAENEDTSKNKDVSRYHYYVCGLKIGNTDYTVRAVVAEQPNGERYYDHKLTQIEKGTLLDSLSGITTPGFNQETFPVSMGKDSKLHAILQTNASKIIDENGEPMVVYHGTDNPGFSIFNSLGKFRKRNATTKNTGIYATNDRWVAYAYTSKQDYNNRYDYRFEKSNNEGQVYALFMYCKKPLIIDCKGEDFDNIRFNGRKTTTDTVARKTRKGDYGENIDGIIFINVYDVDYTTEYIAFSPNQIKSATDNIGTFDNRLNDIRFRSVKDGEFLNRNNLTPEEFSRLTNSIANAMDTNDHNHRMTWFTERHFDSMQRLANLISDIPGTNPDSQYSPWITQNQAKSRAQAAIRH